MQQTLKRHTKDLLRRGGWELHRFDPQRSLPNYLDSVLALQPVMSVQPIYEGAVDVREAIATFNAAGFVLSQMFPVSHDDELRLIEFDCIMVRSRLRS